MKHLSLTILFTIVLTSAFSQSIFFDNVEFSTWTSDEVKKESAFKKQVFIHLLRMKDPYTIDSLDINRTVWEFTEDLTISHYDVKTKRKTVLRKYKYSIDDNEPWLILTSDKLPILKYEVEWASDYNHASFTRKD